MTSPSPAGKRNQQTRTSPATLSGAAARVLKVAGEDARGPCVHIKGASEPAWVLQRLDRTGPDRIQLDWTHLNCW